MSAMNGLVREGFWRRAGAMLTKEFIQLKRDRVSFVMIIMIPLMQLVLFGYAINTTPRDLPTAVLLQETSDVGRSILKALENTRYFKITHEAKSEYVIVGFIQASLIVAVGVILFGVPILGSLLLLALLSTLFISTNLAIGYTFSTLAQNQLQAMQMTIMFFLPNILLSGFMFPFLGMPVWAQWIGEFLALTHYLRIVRSIMLKGAGIVDLRYDTLALFGLMLIAMTIAVTRFRRTLD